MTTARALITRSFKKAGILAAGGTLTAEEANDGLSELNSMLGMWSNASTLIYARTLESFTLTANDGEYTIGTGADFNTTRPMFIVSAYVRSGTTDYPVSVISDEAFAQIVTKETGSIPEWLNFDNGYPTARVKLWPRPSIAYSLFLLSEKPLTSISTLDTVISLPPGWEDAIMYNLAVRLCPEYGQEPDALTLKFAEDGKGMIELTIQRNQSMDFGPNSSYQNNIYTGWQ